MTILFFILPAIVARIYSIAVSSATTALATSPYLMRGMLSDIAVGAALGLALAPLRRWRGPHTALWVLWCLALALNVEHIKFNASNASFSFSGFVLDKEFFFGSVLVFSNAVAALVVLAISIGLIWGLKRVSLPKPRAALGIQAAAAVLALLLIAVLPRTTTNPYWLQMNLLEENLRALVSEPDVFSHNTMMGASARERFFSTDLTGKPIVKLPAGRHNVLLIMVEGISQEAVETGRLPAMGALAMRSLSYTNFIGLQHQTNRGVYSIICGDYPNYLTKEAKSDYVGVYGPRRDCMPAMLGAAGYHTIFMQSAPLGFMQKDLFAEKAGFDEIIGYEELLAAGRFQEASQGTLWGYDDRTLYNAAVHKLKQLRGSRGPWFMSLLTASTHHPFNVPGEKMADDDTALKFADASLGDFLDNLRRDSLIDDTIVIITSDEAAFTQQRQPVLQELSLLHIPLVVILPERTAPMKVKEIFTQRDLLLSLADYLGLDAGLAQGRSIFRSYGLDPEFFSGSVYTSRIYGFSGDGGLYICSHNLDCSTFGFDKDSLFRETPKRAAPDGAFVADLKEALAFNEISSEKLKTSVLIEERGRSYRGTRQILGDHKVLARVGDVIRWDLKVRAGGKIWVKFGSRYSTSSSSDKFEYLFIEYKVMEAGEEMTFSKRYEVSRDIDEIQTNLYIQAYDDGVYSVDEFIIQRFKARSGGRP